MFLVRAGVLTCDEFTWRDGRDAIQQRDEGSTMTVVARFLPFLMTPGAKAAVRRGLRDRRLSSVYDGTIRYTNGGIMRETLAEARHRYATPDSLERRSG
jgi:hypothetical protein